MNLDKDELLAKVKEVIGEELETGNYKLWIKSLQIESIYDNKITLIAWTEEQKYNVEKRLYDLLQSAFEAFTGNIYEIEVIVKYKNLLNSNYTFENFIVEDNIKVAKEVAYAVSEILAKKYNPLYIYGKRETGKTHLIQAIGSRILQNNSNYKILYVDMEDFMNNYLGSYVDEKQLNLFEDICKNMDVLLLDNIQFIAGRKMAQEELLHIFNILYQDGKQIVIVGDKSPLDIPLVQEELKNRFTCGIIVDI